MATETRHTNKDAEGNPGLRLTKIPHPEFYLRTITDENDVQTHAPCIMVVVRETPNSTPWVAELRTYMAQDMDGDLDDAGVMDALFDRQGHAKP